MTYSPRWIVENYKLKEIQITIILTDGCVFIMT